MFWKTRRKGLKFSFVSLILCPHNGTSPQPSTAYLSLESFWSFVSVSPESKPLDWLLYSVLGEWPADLTAHYKYFYPFLLFSGPALCPCFFFFRVALDNSKSWPFCSSAINCLASCWFSHTIHYLPGTYLTGEK